MALPASIQMTMNGSQPITVPYQPSKAQNPGYRIKFRVPVAFKDENAALNALGKSSVTFAGVELKRNEPKLTEASLYIDGPNKGKPIPGTKGRPMVAFTGSLNLEGHAFMVTVVLRYDADKGGIAVRAGTMARTSGYAVLEGVEVAFG